MMAALVSDMLVVLAVWLALVTAFAGLGLALFKLAGLPVAEGRDGLSVFWVGWALVLLALHIWHLFFRIDGWAVAAILLPGWVALIWRGRDLLGLLPRLRFGWPALLLTGVAVVWLANRSLAPPLHYDTGLYHLAAIRWAETYPIVPGLANLHGRLAFNSSHFLYTALMGALPGVPDNPYHFPNGILVAALFAEAFINLTHVIWQRGRLDGQQWLWALLLLPAILEGAFITGATTDQPVFVIGAVMMMRLLALLQDSQHDGETDRKRVLLIVLLAAGATTVKLSAVVLGAAASAVALAAWLGRYRGDGGALLRGWALPVALGVLLLATWALRGVVLSGYLAYPSTVGAGLIPDWVTWQAPEAQANYQAEFVYVWARLGSHYEVLPPNDWTWVGPWVERMLTTVWVVFPLLLGLAGAGILVVAVRGRIGQRVWEWLWFGPLALALLFWFFTAPDYRFASAAIWLTGGGLLAFGLERWGLLTQARSGVVLLAMPLVLVLLLSLGAPVTTPDDPFGFDQTPEIELMPFETDWGLTLYEPVRVEDECWDSNFLCTPEPSATVRLREPGNLRWGFESQPAAP